MTWINRFPADLKLEQGQIDELVQELMTYHVIPDARPSDAPEPAKFVESQKILLEAQAWRAHHRANAAEFHKKFAEFWLD